MAQNTAFKGRMVFNKIIDGKTLAFSIIQRFGTQVVSKDPKSYYPNFSSTTPQVYEPVLSLPGDSSNQIKGTCTWYYKLPTQTEWKEVTSGKDGFTVKTSGSFSLSLNKNYGASLDIKCEYVYTDPDTRLTSNCVATCTTAQVENTGSTIMVIMEKPLQVFTTKAGQVESIVVSGRMVRGADDDITHVTYSWEIEGVDGKYYPIVAATAPVGSGLPAGNLFEGWTTNALTVHSDAIINVGDVRLTCKDIDEDSSTFSKSVSGVATLLDTTDPAELIFDQTMGGNISKGNTTGLPVVIGVRQGKEYWNATDYNNKTIHWWRDTAAGAKDASWAPAAADFSGWTIAGGDISRTFNDGNGTDANRTIRIIWDHLLDNAVTTVFEGSIEF